MYSYNIPEDKRDMYAASRAEDVEASYKDLAEVCGRIRRKNANWAISFLELASEGVVPVLYKRHNKNLGHRKELGGAKGRYPLKAAKAVLKALKSAVANSVVKGMSEDLIVIHAAANKKMTYPRLAPKGRRFKQNYETSRIEIIVKEKVETSKESRKERIEKMKKAKAPVSEKVPESKDSKETKKQEEPHVHVHENEHEHGHTHAHTPEEHKHEIKEQHSQEKSEAKAEEKKSEKKVKKQREGSSPAEKSL